MFGKILGNVVRLVNVPAKALDELIKPEEADLPRISTPLEKLAEAFEDCDKKDKEVK